MTKAEVMTRAWEIRKSENTTMSIALVRAWAESKKTETITIEIVAEKIENAFSFWSPSVWCKGNMERVYLGKNGYVSLIDGKVIANMKTLRDTKRINELFAA